ncbi:hypothetical protein F444_10372 [Phytophthora nicotianae P1976]|uniref:RxLR effector protein n=1 Tax=Phytophthora nicotianae P1976 TaxID=1317066 RepID=A0A081A486_PHYNI|nr:hypothetical protein F444_10372 [Phytophthora nicotianae P1976]
MFFKANIDKHCGDSTYKWWNLVGLNKLVPAKKDLTYEEITAVLKNIQSTEEFRVYKHFAADFDEHMINMFGSSYNRPEVFFDKNATPLEKMARAQIWAETNREDHHVKEFLGLLRPRGQELSKNELAKDPFYQHYLKVMKQKAGG